MNKLQWKVFSIFTILALALALCPSLQVSAADGDGTITGRIVMIQPNDNNANFNVDAYPVGGGPGHCNVNNLTSYNSSTHSYNYSISNCDSSKEYTVTASGWGYTFISVPVHPAGFTGDPLTAPAPDITPVTRVFSGHVYRPDGIHGLNSVVVNYTLNGTDGTATTATDDSGLYTIPGVTDDSTLYIHQLNIDGYNFKNGDWQLNPPWNNDQNYDFRSSGTRNINGHIETPDPSQGCLAGVTITVAAPGAVTQTALTDGNSNWHMNNLEPLNTYVVTPSRTGCVFTPASQTIDIRNGDMNQDVVFKVPSTGVYGTVKSTLGTGGNFASLAYYLIATYTTADGVSYTNSVNWNDGGYWIQVPPNTGGTLIISRIGGPAAFGYETAGATKTGITLTNAWVEEDFTLTPSRTISGTIVGQGGVPVQKNATIDFGYSLEWTQANSPTTTYSIKAQPKLYYLSPEENGLLSSSPVRFLANLTSAAAVTKANFTMILQTYLLDGCLHSNDNDSLVLATGSVRFQPAAGYGSTLYPVSLDPNKLDSNGNSRCGPSDTYYSVRLPQGIAGGLEADNHTLQGNNGSITIDGINWDKGQDYTLLGNRSITGRIYAPNQNINNFNTGDFGGGGFLVLRDAASDDIVQAPGEVQSSFELSIPQLEAKKYTLSINRDQIPNGYVAQPFPMDPIVPIDLTAGDVDIPAASGFVLTHAPIDPTDTSRHATGGGYFIPTGTSKAVVWNYPPMNNGDWFNSFDVQFGPATTAFTDSSPAPVSYQPNGSDPGYTFTGLTAGVLYRWRVRAVFNTDKGPWLDTSPVPTDPIATNDSAYSANSTSAGPVNFTWKNITPDGVVDTSKLRYIVQYSTSAVFTTATQLTSAAGATTSTTSVSTGTTNPAIKTTYYWRVMAQYNTGSSSTPIWVNISDWSPTQTFFNRYMNLTSPTFQWDVRGWNPNPVRFLATNPNTSLPVDAYYLVDLSNDSFATDHYWLFTRTATGSTPSARQYLDSLPAGTYAWKISILNGNDHYGSLITGWTDAPSTIHIDPH